METSDRSTHPMVRSMRSTVGREATTFGFSILVTVTFGLLSATRGAPTVPEVFAYAVGAVLSFTLLEGLLSRGFRRPMPQHATQTITLGTSLNVLSVVAALAAAWGIAVILDGLPAWFTGPLVAGVVYLLTESIEETIAERVLVRSGDPDAAEVSNQDS